MADSRKVTAHYRLGAGPLQVRVPVTLWLVPIYLAGLAAWRHPKVTVTLVVLVGLRLWLESWAMVGVLCGAAAGVCLTGWLAWHRRGSAGDHGKLSLAGHRHRRVVQARWAEAMDAAHVGNRAAGKVPGLRRVRAMPDGSVQADCSPGRAHSTVEELQAASNQIRQVLGARTVDVVELGRDGSGHARITVRWGNALADTVPLDKLPASPRGRVAFGVTEDGKAASLSLSTSALIVGMTGAGKSGVVWGMLASLRQQGTPVRLRIIDPLGEFAVLGAMLGQDTGSMRVHAYTTSTGKPAEDILTGAVRGLDARVAAIPHGRRKVDVSAAEPLDITIIDEGLRIPTILKQGAGGPLGALTTGGRRANYVVWMLAQVGHKETLGEIRGTIPQRVCLATSSTADTDVVLGTGADKAGARASGHDMKPGMCYVQDEELRGFVKARAVRVDDEATVRIAQDRLAEPELGFIPRAWVYRFYDDAGALLYIGKTVDWRRRFAEHEDKPWWHEQRSSTSEPFASEEEALEAEREAIIREQPKHNIIYRRVPASTG